MEEKELQILLNELIISSVENEWIEFKLNYQSPDEIGKRISALANGASLFNKKFGYLFFGIKNDNHTVMGTSFNPRKIKTSNQELEHWLTQGLDPKLDFRILEFNFDNKHIVCFKIPSAEKQPIRFKGLSYIRVGSTTRKLNDFPEKEKKIWNKKTEEIFEKDIALKNLSSDEIISLLDTQSYFDLLDIPYPQTRETVLEKFTNEGLIIKNIDKYSITNLGGILFAKDLNKFPSLVRKAIRVIIYEGKNKIKTKKEQIGIKGYAVGFEGLINWINDQLPANEEMGKVFRKEVRMYPEPAIKELVANVLIHQDFFEKGTGPMVEIFSDRIEFSNPGIPLITTMRFIDEFQSRNDILASFMRRFGICEERGSGIDKVIIEVELYQLPGPEFLTMEKHTKVTLYSHRRFNDMSKKDKIRACYQHCCIKYISNEKMTNKTLRERFNIDQRNSAIISRIIDSTIKVKLIKVDDPDNTSRKYAKYIPIWS